MFLLCPLLLGLAPAFAETPSTLAWSWPFGEVSRWHLETTYVAPRGLVFAAANAQGQVQQARAARTDLALDVECTPSALGKKTKLTCTFATVRLSGAPVGLPADDNLPAILETLSADLRGGTVEVVQSPDGRIVSFDLQGLVRTNLASGAIIDQDRALLQRAFCGFELPLPKAGVVHPWKDAGTSALMTLQTSTGTTGNYELSYVVQPLLDDVVTVVTTGGGTLSYGSAMDSGTSDRPDRTVTMAAGGSPAGLSYVELSVRGDQANFDGGARMITTQVTSVAAFDPTGSRVTWRKINLDGRQTASGSEAGNDIDFLQSSSLELVDAFADGAAPPPWAVTRASQRADAAPAPKATLVAFSTLSAPPLRIAKMPTVAAQLGLPTSTVSARVEVDATGVVTEAHAFKGYEALAGPCERTLVGAHFPKTDAPYTVDVDVEYLATP